MQYQELLYALEPTGIGTFEGLLKLQNEAWHVFGPIEAAVRKIVPNDEVYELEAPALGLQGKSGREVRQVQEALISPGLFKVGVK